MRRKVIFSAHGAGRAGPQRFGCLSSGLWLHGAVQGLLSAIGPRGLLESSPQFALIPLSQNFGPND